MSEFNTDIKEAMIARATGNLSGDALDAFNLALKNDPSLQAELETVERALAVVRDGLPSAETIDLQAFKDRLRFSVGSASGRKAPARRPFAHLISRGGFYGFHWRWNWVPYAVSVCAVSLVLFSLSWIVVESRADAPAGEQTAMASGADDLWMPIRYVPEDRLTVEKLNGRTVRVRGIAGPAVVVGERLSGADLTYLQVFNAAAFDQTVQSRGSQWRQTVDIAQVVVTDGSLTIPEPLFNKYIARGGNVSTLKVVNIGNPASEGFIELWNPNAYLQYQSGLTCLLSRPMTNDKITF
ncbi:MAG: hypothetical protein ABIH86_00245 [Planctomycetota bacterium]